MKKFFLLLIACVFASAVSAQDQADSKRQYMVYGVAFYNLENLFDTINANGKYDLEFSPNGAKKWDSVKYWSKINNMAQAIASMKSDYTPLGPAVIGVAEVENKSVLNDLVANDQIKDLNLQVVHHDSPDRRGIDVSLLYNPDLFEVINVTNHRLTIKDDPGFLTRDHMCVTGRMGNDIASIIVNHWPSRLGGEERSRHLRDAAAQLCKNMADSIWNINPNQCVIIMGDLNDDPYNNSCAKVLGAKKKHNKVKKHGFYNPFWKTFDSGYGTLSYKGAWNLFDQIIVSGTLLDGNSYQLKYWRHEIVYRDFLLNQDGKYKGQPLRTFAGGRFLNGYSDHLPSQIYLIQEVK